MNINTSIRLLFNQTLVNFIKLPLVSSSLQIATFTASILLGFGRTGETVVCDPSDALLYDCNNSVMEGNGSNDNNRPVPWNILDHCGYLGIFVGQLW